MLLPRDRDAARRPQRPEARVAAGGDQDPLDRDGIRRRSQQGDGQRGTRGRRFSRATEDGADEPLRGVLARLQAPQGSEHIKQILVGSILTVTPAEVGRLALLYAPIGLIHWLARRPLLDISFDPDGAGARRAVRWWDFVFYASFGVVVTSSVRLAGAVVGP